MNNSFNEQTGKNVFNELLKILDNNEGPHLSFFVFFQ